MKTCVDCKWCDDPESSVPACMSPKHPLSPVTGKTDWILCFLCRRDRDTGIICGKDGDWFEPRMGIEKELK